MPPRPPPKRPFSPCGTKPSRSEEHTSELQSLRHLVCRLLLEKKKKEANARLPTAYHGRRGGRCGPAAVLLGSKTTAARGSSTRARGSLRSSPLAFFF